MRPPPPPPLSVVDATPRQCNSKNTRPQPPPTVFEHLRQVEGEVMQSHPAFSSDFYRTLLQSILENQSKAKTILGTIQSQSRNEQVAMSSALVVPYKHSPVADPTFLFFVSIVAAAAILEKQYKAPEAPPAQSPHFSGKAQDNDDLTVSTHTTTSSTDDDSDKKELAAMKRKLKKYKKRNKDLLDDFGSNRRAYLELENKYDLLKLQLAQVKAAQDETQVAAHEHMMGQDLQLLNLAHENDIVAADLQKMTAARDAALKKITELEKAVIHRDLRRIELSNERDGLGREVKRAVKQRDDARNRTDALYKERDDLKKQVRELTFQVEEARFKLKEMGLELESPEQSCQDGKAITASRWKRKLLTRLPRRGRRNAEDAKVNPIEEQ